MKTAQEKFFNDPHYASMVNLLMSLIQKGNYTPSELREMVIFACTRYELMFRRPNIIPINPEVTP